MLQFDDATTKLLEIAYAGGDISKRRSTSLNAVAPAPGDQILDIGCGNGLLTAELARAVGPNGMVVGVDPSDDMRTPANARTSDYNWVRIDEGTASELPVDDAWADAAVSLQVFEYLNDVPASLAEAHRALKPGGRLVIGDMMFNTLSWFSDHTDRMGRMIASWDRHVVETNLPAKMPELFRKAGFAVERVIPLTFVDHVLRPDGIATMMIALMERYAVSNAHVGADEARAWADEQRELAASGRFFFTLTHVVVVGRKP